MKRFFSILVICILIMALLTAAAPAPRTAFKAGNSTARAVDEVSPVNVVVSVQHGGGHIAIQRYVFKAGVR
jgi:hypothetical protein